MAFNLRKYQLALLIPATFLVGCTGLTRVDTSPVTPTASEWRKPQGSTAEAKALWWSSLGDEALNELVTQALDTSPTMEIAYARLDAARAARGQLFSAAYPSLNINLQATRIENGASGIIQNQQTARVDSIWELDLFGAVSRGRESANARELSAQYLVQDARISLSAEVVSAYTAYRSCRVAQSINEEDLNSRRKTHAITLASIEAGLTAPYLRARTEASLSDAMIQFANLTSQCEQAEQTLVRLTGLELAKLQSILQAKQSNTYLGQVQNLWAIGMPADVLASRPDVRSSMALRDASAADMGLAKADELPRLSLTGGLNFTRQENSSSVSFGGWSFGPSLSLPFFDGGRKKSATAGAQARLREAQAVYQAKVRSAMQEVEEGFSRYRASLTRLAEAETAASKYQIYFDAVNDRYTAGASNLLELEDARRTWLQARQALLGAQQEHLASWTFINRVTAASTGQSAPQP